MYYTGVARDLKKRMNEHNLGLTKGAFTKSKLPVELVYWERFNSRIEAARREREIKGWDRRKKEGLINSLHRGALATRWGAGVDERARLESE